MSRDGRRSSDPLTDPNPSPALAPDYHLWVHRDANDGSTPDFLSGVAGINFGGLRKGLLQAIPRDGVAIGDDPGGAANVTLTEYEWSPGANAFVVTGNTFNAGVGKPVVAAIDANGRKMYYAVTGLEVDTSVSIYVSAFGPEQTH